MTRIACHFLLLLLLCPAALAQTDGQSSSKTCHHRISLYQLSPAIQVYEIRITTMGKTRIALAKAPAGFATGTQYPSQVVWKASMQPNFPLGNPISDGFELVMEPQHGQNHTLEVTWASQAGVICSKNLEIDCPLKPTPPSRRKGTYASPSAEVIFRDGMLDFKDSLTCYRFYQGLLPKHNHNVQTHDAAIDSIAHSLAQRFPGFQPLRLVQQDSAWRIHPLLATLLNQQQAMRVKGVLFAFDGPFRLYQLPPSQSHPAQLKRLIEQQYKAPLPAHAQFHLLLHDPLAPVPPENPAFTGQAPDACNTLFASPSD